MAVVYVKEQGALVRKPQGDLLLCAGEDMGLAGQEVIQTSDIIFQTRQHLGPEVQGSVGRSVAVAQLAPEVLLLGLPLIAGLLLWALRMTFEPDSPLIDPEHLYRRPGFLLVAIGSLAALLFLAAS